VMMCMFMALYNDMRIPTSHWSYWLDLFFYSFLSSLEYSSVTVICRSVATLRTLDGFKITSHKL